MKITVIYGPRACGKTHNAEMLRRKFGCTRVVEDGELELAPAALRQLPGETLVLTNRSLNECISHFGSARIVSFEGAMR